MTFLSDKKKKKKTILNCIFFFFPKNRDSGSSNDAAVVEMESDVVLNCTAKWWHDAKENGIMMIQCYTYADDILYPSISITIELYLHAQYINDPIKHNLMSFLLSKITSLSDKFLLKGFHSFVFDVF